MFCNRSFNEMYFRKEEHTILLEIRFKTATLTCLFNAQRICERAFLFLDDAADIIRLVKYCDRTYHYIYPQSCWLTPNSIIQINAGNKECDLLVVPLAKVNF